MAQTNLSMGELFRRLTAYSPLLSHGRTTSTIYLLDSVRYDTFGNSTWLPVQLNTYGYYPTNRTAWDSSFEWGRGQWDYQTTVQYYYYTSGPYAGYDSLHLEWDAGSSAPAARMQFSYTSPTPGYLRLTAEYSEWDTSTNQWVPINRLYASLPANRYTGLPIPSVGEREPLPFRTPPPDSLRIEVYFNNAWTTFYREASTLTAGRWDSTYISLNVEPLLGTPGWAAGFVKPFYDAQGRIIRERDTAWICIPLFCNNPSQAGPALAMTTYYFYSGSAPYPAQDSVYSRDYGDNTTTVTKSLYTYDSNGNLSQRIRQLRSGTQWLNRERWIYRYIARQALALAKGEETLNIPTVHTAGGSLVLKGNPGLPYALYDLSGRELLRGVFSAPEATLQLPAQSGIYVLRVGDQAKRLCLLP